jgi:hypothetical protein
MQMDHGQNNVIRFLSHDLTEGEREFSMKRTNFRSNESRKTENYHQTKNFFYGRPTDFFLIKTLIVHSKPEIVRIVFANHS